MSATELPLFAWTEPEPKPEQAPAQAPGPDQACAVEPEPDLDTGFDVAEWDEPPLDEPEFAPEPEPEPEPGPELERTLELVDPWHVAPAEVPADLASDPLVAKLNPEQQRAVLTTDGPVLVLAGAGSGKTRVITHRIAWLIARCGVPAWQILAMTFTNKAAGEMRERAQHLLSSLGSESARDLWLGTFHSVGVRLLRQLAPHAGMDPSFTIYDTDDQLKVLTKVCKSLNISENHYKPKQFAGYIDRAKNRLQLPGDPALPRDNDFDRKAQQVYSRYESEMRLANAVDFGDLILLPTKILAEHPEVCQNLSRRFRYVLVDEFQDTNFAQFQLLQYLTSWHGNLCVVGDDDQSIYSWRGAEVGNILGFPDKFDGAQVVKLERNYRSTETILKASTAVVARNSARHGKVLWTDAGMGEPITLHISASDRDEADWVARRIEQVNKTVPLSEIAVFYRTNSLSRVLEDSMRRFRLPYVLIGGMKFYERAEVKDALAWCRLLVNPVDSAAWLRAVAAPRRGIGQTTIDAVQTFASNWQLSLPEAARRMVERGEGGRAKDKLVEFDALVSKMRQHVQGQRADEAGTYVLQASGLRAALQADASEESKDRLDNLQQLLAAMAEHAESADDPGLRSFLENVALVADTDKLGENTAKVSMMTMHAAKGLEFDVAFVIGLEEGLLPHANVIGEAQSGASSGREVEEERRLFYVGMTRARKKLHLSYARQRRRFDGRDQEAKPSRFVEQVPLELLQVEDEGGGWRSAGGAWGGHAASSASWDRPAASGGGGSFGGVARGQWGQRPAAAPGGRPAAGAWSRPAGAGVWQQPASGDDEPVFDRSERSDGRFVRGGKAQHERFGVGTVLDIAGYGDQAQLTVQFVQHGVKKIVARFLKPA